MIGLLTRFSIERQVSSRGNQNKETKNCGRVVPKHGIRPNTAEQLDPDWMPSWRTHRQFVIAAAKARFPHADDRSEFCSVIRVCFETGGGNILYGVSMTVSAKPAE